MNDKICTFFLGGTVPLKMDRWSYWQGWAEGTAGTVRFSFTV